MPKYTYSGPHKIGDVIWVNYRKSVFWPAKIKNLYPKKITYVFFPLEEKAQIFSTDEKKIISFKDYQPPPNSKVDLLEAYEMAVRYTKGEIIIRPAPIINNSQFTSTPKKNASGSSGYMIRGKNFKPGDVIIVETELGMWPALLSGIEDSKFARYTLFPRNDEQVMLQSDCNSIHTFPKAEIDTMIEERGTEEMDLLNALQDVKLYINEPEKKANKTKSKIFPKASISAKTIDRNKNLERSLTLPSSKGLQRTFHSKRRAFDDTFDTPNMKKPKSENISNANALKSEVMHQREKEIANDAHKKINYKTNLLEIAISEEAKDYMNSIWGNHMGKRIEAAHKKALDLPLQLKLNFEYGFMPPQSVDKFVTEVSRWINSSPKLPNMSEFKKMHYVANFVLPELIAFAISKDRSCPISEAKKIIEIQDEKASNGLMDFAKSDEPAIVRATPLANLALVAQMKLGEDARH